MENEREKVGLSEEERLSIDKMIIVFTERITALTLKETALTNEKAALTNEKVELMKVAQGIVHDHM